MKYLPTTVLLDLAKDIHEFAEMYIGERSLATDKKLAEIDTELLSRMPDEEFIIILGEDGNPVGFEPYIPNEDEAWLFDALYGYIEGIPTVDEAQCSHEWVEGYYGIRCSKCNAFVANGHGPWMPVDEGRL